MPAVREAGGFFGFCLGYLTPASILGFAPLTFKFLTELSLATIFVYLFIYFYQMVKDVFEKVNSELQKVVSTTSKCSQLLPCDWPIIYLR